MIGIIDYGAGNIRSVCNALDRLGAQYVVSSDVAELRRAERLILPGVGEARSAMESLDRRGLLSWLTTVETPFLGICIGMQILFHHSTERDTACLDILPGTVEKFDTDRKKVPHMGWNTVRVMSESPLFYSIAQSEYFYFVHSYYAPLVDETIGVTNYGVEFSAAVARGNFYGVQFHAEKSGRVGLQVIENFLTRC